MWLVFEALVVVESGVLGPGRPDAIAEEASTQNRGPEASGGCLLGSQNAVWTGALWDALEAPRTHYGAPQDVPGSYSEPSGHAPGVPGPSF